MAKSRRNSGIDYWKILRLFASLGLMVFLLYSVSNKLNAPIDNLRIIIDDNGDKKNLITSKEVRTMLKYEMGYDISLADFRQLKLFELEAAFDRDDRVESAEIFVDKHNVMNILIRQKQPIVRIDAADGKDYYLDYSGDRIPVTDVFRVPVVTGQVDEYKPGFQKTDKNNLNAVLKLARKVHDDQFLTALVEQIHIDNKDEITIVPKVGRDKILIGEIDGLDEKIYRLKTYYEHGVKKIGLDKFDELDFRYEGQMIGRQKDT